MTLSEALIKAEEFKKEKSPSDIIDLLTPFWNEKVTTNVGALLAYAYRRDGDYSKCLEICDAVDNAFNFPAKIKAQKQWCFIVRDIIHATNDDAEEAALNTIQSLNPNNAYDFGMIKFICLVRANENDIDKAIEWFERIPVNKLNNKTQSVPNEYTGSIRMGISEKHGFYLTLIKYLKEKDKIVYYLEKILSNFSNDKKALLIESIMTSISVANDKGVKSIREKKLAHILMHLKESNYFIRNNIVKVTDSLRMSDIAAYVFCPISAVISKTLDIKELSLEYNDAVSYSKKFINDYYEIVKNKKEPWLKILKESTDNNFCFTDVQNNILSRIFNAQRVALNSRVGSVHMSNIFKGADISFSPDMLLEDEIGKFCVEEIFTSKQVSLLSSPYENDKIKLVGYLRELNINFGFLIYWNITYTSGNKKNAQITGLKIFEIRLNESNTKTYVDYKSRIKKLISEGQEHVPNINFNKCISCSVMHYCIHKMGHSNTLLYPYRANYIT